MPDALDAARALLPAWVTWFPLLAAAWAAVAGALVVALPVLVASRPVARLAPDAPWTERARLTWPARRVAWLGVGLGAVLGVAAWTGGPLSRPLGAWSGLLAPALAVLAGLAVAFAAEDRLVRKVPARRRAAGLATVLLVLVPGFLLALLAPVLIPAGAAPWRLLALVAVVVVLQAGAGLVLGRALGLVGPAPEGVARALAEAWAGRAGPPPRLWTLRLVSANAYAFPLHGAVAVTPALAEALAHEEVVAVLRHEVAHLDEPRAAKLARLGVAAGVPAAIAVGLGGGPGSPLRPLLCLAAVLALVVAFRRLARPLEERADGAAAPADGPAYARALERIYRHNLAPAAIRPGATHPELFDRMARAGAPPAWARPAPPRTPRLALAVLVVGAAAVASAAVLEREAVRRSAAVDPASALLAVAVQQDADALWWHGTWEAQGGRHEAALAMLGAASALAPQDPDVAASLALWAAGLGRCEEARAALARAVAAGAEGPDLEAAQTVVPDCRPHPRR